MIAQITITQIASLIPMLLVLLALGAFFAAGAAACVVAINFNFFVFKLLNKLNGYIWAQR
jgi:uncharacterized BrkB/YihY/UPF0761 family membrane protein